MASKMVVRLTLLCLVTLAIFAAATSGHQHTKLAQGNAMEAKDMTIHYLEVVTPQIAETCATLEKAHGITFGDPVPELGNARTADLVGGGRIGVRAPLRETESPVVRPYLLVDDIAKAVEVASDAGAEIAIPPMQIPGQGTFSIYILGGIEHGLWQN